MLSVRNLSKPKVVMLTLGDPSGIGAEIVAKFLAEKKSYANHKVVIVADRWHWDAGQTVANVSVPVKLIDDMAAIESYGELSCPLFFDTNIIAEHQVVFSQISADYGQYVLRALDVCMDACLENYADAICFAPLNKQAMKLGGMQHEDELHYFTKYLGVTDYFCELNTLGNLWTARVSSHVPLKDAAIYITKDRIVDAVNLMVESLKKSGIEKPKVAVAAFNPHAGDGGTCGDEEINFISPAVNMLKRKGFFVEGPVAADTVFVKAKAGLFDAVVTMYHDQGQIAMKLMGFEKGVTVQGGLPIPVTTPAHGTAFDIAGKNKASSEAMREAFGMACKMSLR